jgi:hypothetical protein
LRTRLRASRSPDLSDIGAVAAAGFSAFP